MKKPDFKLNTATTKIFWNYIDKDDVVEAMQKLNKKLSLDVVTCIATSQLPWSEEYETVVKELQKYRNYHFVGGIVYDEEFNFSMCELCADLTKTILLVDSTVNPAQLNRLVSQLLSIPREQIIVVIKLYKGKLDVLFNHDV